MKEDYDWLLTMDQDSKLENEDFSKMLDLVKKNFKKKYCYFFSIS